MFAVTLSGRFRCRKLSNPQLLGLQITTRARHLTGAVNVIEVENTIVIIQVCGLRFSRCVSLTVTGARTIVMVPPDSILATVRLRKQMVISA